MPTPLLTKRLLDAKKELTALKTAHSRGLGLVKIYTVEVGVPKAQNLGFKLVTVTLTFSSPYPLILGMPKRSEYSNLLPNGEAPTYSENGYKADYPFLIFMGVNTVNVHHLKFVSTSNIESFTYKIEDGS